MSRRRLFILADLILGVLIVFIVGKLILRQIDQPVSGPVSVGASVPDSGLSYNIDLTPRPVTGPIVNFSVPKGLTAEATQPLSGSLVEELNYTARDVSSWTLAVGINKTDGQLNSNSSYTLFENSPEEYARSQTTVNGQNIVIMTDKDAPGFGEIAFFTHGDFVATVSLTGDDVSGTGPLQTTFNMVLSSWHWVT